MENILTRIQIHVPLKLSYLKMNLILNREIKENFGLYVVKPRLDEMSFYFGENWNPKYGKHLMIKYLHFILWTFIDYIS